jgi:hypothetical protein
LNEDSFGKPTPDPRASDIGIAPAQFRIEPELLTGVLPRAGFQHFKFRCPQSPYVLKIEAVIVHAASHENFVAGQCIDFRFEASLIGGVKNGDRKSNPSVSHGMRLKSRKASNLNAADSLAGFHTVKLARG